MKTIDIFKAREIHMPAVQEIFKEYQKDLNTPVCFQNFEQELANLPGLYKSPTGAIYLAVEDAKVIGCVCIRPIFNNKRTISRDTAELKRLYVRADKRGLGVGIDLFQKAINEAKALGYKFIVLETMDKMKKAKSLYLRYGFESIPAYFENADRDVECFRYKLS